MEEQARREQAEKAGRKLPRKRYGRADRQRQMSALQTRLWVKVGKSNGLERGEVGSTEDHESGPRFGRRMVIPAAW